MCWKRGAAEAAKRKAADAAVDVDVARLDAVIAYLQSEPKVVVNPYPQYHYKVREALSFLGTDVEYLSKHDKLKDRPIESMNLDDLRVMLTFIARGERFCDGHIASYVESGELLKLMLRLRELVE